MIDRMARLGLGSLLLILSATATAAGPPKGRLQSADLLKLQRVEAARVSPDGSRVAYTVSRLDGPGRPTSRIWVMRLPDGNPARIGAETDKGSDPEWSPDGRRIAFHLERGEKTHLAMADADGGSIRILAEVTGTNSPLTYVGRSIAWSPDGRRIAFVSATPGPETADATGDPMVITRYLYRPDDAEGNSRFNDNLRRHIFVVDAADGTAGNAKGGTARQLTDGRLEEHSIDWSPDGLEILFVSNREPDPDLFYNPDLFTLKVADGTVRRLTATESAEFQPRWSPDGKSIAFMGTRRGLTDLETDMEDTHIWVMDRDGGNRREPGSAIDKRQAAHGWMPDGDAILCTVVDRGSQHLYRLPVAGGAPEAEVREPGRVEDWSIAADGTLVWTYAGPRDFEQLFVRARGGPPRPITALNQAVLDKVAIAPVESFTFVSNDNRLEVEAFLTRPLGMTTESKHPLIVMIHGGPHWFSGPAFSFRSQAYAARGWATLQVNYRGSTGYGQSFADAVFADQNGNEAQDVLYAVSAALRRNLWIDRDRLGIEGTSYGGQLTFWLITQTHLFKAAIPLAGITNNLSYNYMTYYNMYEQMEWGALPHQGNLMDVLWERSALKHVAKVKTPTMIVHGENDNDVPIAESEQFYIALKDVGVETVMVRYPREGHGLREPKHLVDLMDRSVRWYEAHFAVPAPARARAAERHRPRG